ncbi:MAG: carboxypeptidase regulatory-like domain-containing protein, partial [Acidobacteria bacterium]|nr:carboxypeptidase regulatory-like domain-containing protein [Acidobacteriota bacterium]
MSAPLFKHTPARGHDDAAHDDAASRLRALLFRAAPLPLLLLLLLLSASASRPCVAQEPAAAADKAGASKKIADASKQAGAAENKPAPRPSNVTGSIKGRVVGEGGEPLQGVTINASRRGGGMLSGPPPMATTDEEGQFALNGLEPNVYGLNVSLPGYVVEPDTPTSSSRSRVRLGDTVTLRMMKGGVITGTVTDASGEPLVGANVRVMRVREMEGRPTPFGSSTVRDELTDDRGIYR